MEIYWKNLKNFYFLFFIHTSQLVFMILTLKRFKWGAKLSFSLVIAKNVKINGQNLVKIEWFKFFQVNAIYRRWLIILMIFQGAKTLLFDVIIQHIWISHLSPIGIEGANMQGQTEPLLETHSTDICAFLIATTVYYYAHSVDLKSQLHRENSSLL